MGSVCCGELLNLPSRSVLINVVNGHAHKEAGPGASHPHPKTPVSVCSRRQRWDNYLPPELEVEGEGAQTAFTQLR